MLSVSGDTERSGGAALARQHRVGSENREKHADRRESRQTGATRGRPSQALKNWPWRSIFRSRIYSILPKSNGAAELSDILNLSLRTVSECVSIQVPRIQGERGRNRINTLHPKGLKRFRKCSPCPAFGVHLTLLP